MQRRSRFWWRSTLPVAFLVVVVVSAWSWWVQPETSQIGFARVPGGAQSSIILNNESAEAPLNKPCAAWRMHVRIDAALKAPGPAWVMFEGGRLGDGYELHWQPARLCLTLLRSSAPIVLGAVTLDHMPSHVVLVRHGFRLQILVDEQIVLQCVDPQTTVATTKWGFQAAGPMEGSTVSLFDEQRLLPTTTNKALTGNQAVLKQIISDPQATDHAWFIIQQALHIDAEKFEQEKNAALQQAAIAISAFSAESSDRNELQHWIAWGRMHVALARQDIDTAERATMAMQQFALLAKEHPATESAGLAMELMEHMAQRCMRPIHRAPADVLAWRTAWLSMIEQCTEIALSHESPVLSKDWQWQLRLLAHASLCLRGKPGNPTPAEAPEWVTTRWRAFAGGNPGVLTFPSIVAQASDERNPIRSSLDRLVQLAAFEPGGLSAVTMSATLNATLHAPPPANAMREVIDEQRKLNHANTQAVMQNIEAPTRELILARAILALHNMGDVQTALEALDPDPNHQLPTGTGTTPLARQDPLAYALYRLLQHRQLGQHAVKQHADPFTKPQALPAALISPFGRLLSGQHEATQEVAWIPDPNVLPPAQTLAAALAMQEVMGIETVLPNWSLLEQLPCFTLPIHLMKPNGTASRLIEPTAPQTPVVP